jgi:hypothetical protein
MSSDYFSEDSYFRSSFPAHDTFSDNTVGFLDEHSDRSDRQSYSSDLAPSYEFETYSYVTDETQAEPFDEEASNQSSEEQAEDTEIHQYPTRSTRSIIGSYYEPRLQNRFWTKRRNLSRSRCA